MGCRITINRKIQTINWRNFFIQRNLLDKFQVFAWKTRAIQKTQFWSSAQMAGTKRSWNRSKSEQQKVGSTKSTSLFRRQVYNQIPRLFIPASKWLERKDDERDWVSTAKSGFTSNKNKIKINHFFVVETANDSLAFSIQRPNGWIEKTRKIVFRVSTTESGIKKSKSKSTTFSLQRLISHSPPFRPSVKNGWNEKEKDLNQSEQQKVVSKIKSKSTTFSLARLKAQPLPCRPSVRMAGTKRHWDCRKVSTKKSGFKKQKKKKTNQFLADGSTSSFPAFLAQRPNCWNAEKQTMRN